MADLLLDEQVIPAVLEQVRDVGVPKAVRTPKLRRQAAPVAILDESVKSSSKRASTNSWRRVRFSCSSTQSFIVFW